MPFTEFTSYANAYKTFLPEGKNSIPTVAQYADIYNYHWTVVGEGGGEVTLIPVHKQSAQTEYAGYFYCLPGEDINFKEAPKYVFSEGIAKDMKDLGDDYTAKAYRLVYYDKQGNASYTFPEGTKIYFFLHCIPENKAYSWCSHSWDAKLPIDFYSFPDLNYDILHHLNEAHNVNFAAGGGKDQWDEYPRVVYFNRNGVNYVGMEDGTDLDLNDLMLMVLGNVEDFPPSENVTTATQVYTYAFEDTKTGDYDMNDVVLRVWKQGGGSNPTMRVQLVATGAANDLMVYYYDNGDRYSEPYALFGGKEVHEALGIEPGTFANTQTKNVTKFPTTDVTYTYDKFRFYKADFYIKNMSTGQEIHLPAAQGLMGSAPYAFCVPGRWQWPTERTKITSAYPAFAGYASNPDVNQGWYTEVAGSVFNLEK